MRVMPPQGAEILERLCASTADSRIRFYRDSVTQLSTTNSQPPHDCRPKNILRAAQQRAIAKQQPRLRGGSAARCACADARDRAFADEILQRRDGSERARSRV